ncbi:MAG TPA: polymer-forming cytoskeletal protein [Thermoanaerobaculia bacterium]|nr:polymer-forming cytoskeletal protein [Thermoanaerobaculia bacterium]
MANHPGGPTGPAPTTAPPARGSDPRANQAPNPSGKRALVGAATALRGQVSAREDLWIDGQVEGEVQALEHQVTIGPGGRVRAEVKARSVVIEGELHGNVVASQTVTLRTGGRVTGDIRAPRVALEEGCQFQGHVDMDGSQTTAEPATAPPESPVAAESAEPPAAPALVGEGSG